MDFVTTTQVLGNLGEFVGAVAVVVTLFYLAVQVRQSKHATEANTRSIEESRQLTLAQTYFGRAALLFQTNAAIANGLLGEIIPKALSDGVEKLSQVDRGRLRHYCWAQRSYFDSVHYQYQRGYIDPEFYNSQFKAGMKIWGPLWLDLGLDLSELRPEFAQELQRTLSDSTPS